jgi:hypothetical protein
MISGIQEFLELAACDAYNLPLLFSKDVLPDFL